MAAIVLAAILLVVPLGQAWAGSVTFFEGSGGGVDFDEGHPQETTGMVKRMPAYQDVPAVAPVQPSQGIPAGGQVVPAKPGAPAPAEAGKDEDYETSVDPDTGKVTIYKPPVQVKAFVDDPTEEKAEAYLEWMDSKTQKAQKAAQVLTSVVEKKKQATQGQEMAKIEAKGDKPLIVTFITPE